MEVFEQECRALGKACAAARMRLDERAPEAFKQAFKGYRGAKAPIADYFERKWLSLRLSAVKRGMVLDSELTPVFLKHITPVICPVTLEPLETDGKSRRNPSIDRLVNEATYAAGNIGVFSIRANLAKGEKSFEEVAALATAGEFKDGLEGVEWMRLCTLMYGAWSRAVHCGDPYTLPLATYPGPAMLCSTSQVVQLLILRQIDSEDWPAAEPIWQQVTTREEDSFLTFVGQLRYAVALEAYRPSAWLHPGVFDAFNLWYQANRQQIDALVEAYWDKYQVGVDVEFMVRHWLHGARYLAQS
jgi:hypothetical protein